MTRKVGGITRGLVQPGSARLVASVALRSRQQSGRDRVARPANLLVVRDALRRAGRRPGVSVLDQGPLQEWWSAALRGDRDRVLAALAADRAAPRADLLVRVDAPIEVLVERLSGRDVRQSRVEALPPAHRRSELERGSELLDALWNRPVDSSAWPRPLTIRVDGLDATAVSVVVEAVRRCWSEGT